MAILTAGLSVVVAGLVGESLHSPPVTYDGGYGVAIVPHLLVAIRLSPMAFTALTENS